MRLLTLCYEFPPLGGGGGRAAAGLAAALVRAGHEVDVVTMGFRGLPMRECIGGVNVHRVRCVRSREFVCSPFEMATYLASALPLASRLAREHDYALNHTHFVFPDGLLACALRRFTGLPYVVTTHGSDVPGYNPDRFRLAHSLLAPAWNRVVDGIEEVIFPSAAIRELFRKKRTDVPDSLIPYGIELGAPPRTEGRAKRILVVTRMLERKGVQHLLRALEGWHSGFEIHLVGDGPYLPELRALAERLGVDVHFRGWLDRESAELKELYRTSSVFVLVSEMENFPVSLLEAMAAGLAIITTSGTGCAEVVGDSALLVPPRDVARLREALETLVADEALRIGFGQRARTRAETRFDWDAVAARYLEVYARHRRATPRARA